MQPLPPGAGAPIGPGAGVIEDEDEGMADGALPPLEMPPEPTELGPPAGENPELQRARETAFDVKFKPGQQDALVHFLHDEITRAVAARSSIIDPGGDLDYWHWLYAQGKRNVKDAPFPGAADLSTWLITEKIDAMRSRFVKTIFVEPVWTVEGWGKAAERAPMVEEFHQWKVEDERLQSWLQRVFDLALIEGTGVLECAERTDLRKQRKVRSLQPERNPFGALRLSPDAQPLPALDPRGQFLDVDNPDEQGGMDAVVDEIVPVRRGPNYRVVSLRDFLILPGHAQDDSEVWGYAKRFWRRLTELEQRVGEHVYDKDAVAQLAQVSDREASPLPSPVAMTGQQIATQDHRRTIEKELWELQMVADLDDDGIDEWYIVTFSAVHRVILRCKLDDLGMPRYHLFRPYPNPLSVYGRSHVEKLASLGEEHAGVRNAIADRSNFVNNAPLKRLASSSWDPDEEPWGPGAIITVNDPNDVAPMQLPDVPNSMMSREGSIIQAGERLSGLNDVSLGATPDASRTLGEVQMVTEQSFVRIEESIRNMQETLENLFKCRHELWRRAADEAPMEPSTRFIMDLAARGIDLPEGGITSGVLAGQFHGKPRGSVESADRNKQRGNFNGFMAVIGGFAQMNPGLQQTLSSPDVLVPLFEQALRLFDVPNRSQFMRAMRTWQVQDAQQKQMAAMAPPAPPGMPPGGPQAGPAGPGGPPPPGGPPQGAQGPPPPGPPPGSSPGPPPAEVTAQPPEPAGAGIM
jgi:hypothetical protein